MITSGWVGTGKSSVARALCGALGAVRIASDVVRKHRAGVATRDSLRSQWNEGVYAPEERRAVYAALRARAESVLRAGRDVVLDASFASREQRDTLRAWAEDLGVRPWLVQTVCGDDAVADRLAARRRAGDDASDAGPELLPASRDSYEPPTEWPEALHVRVDTEAAEWPGEVEQLARRVAAARFG